MNTINYKILGESQDFYNKLGYNNIEIPWYVTENVMNITKPKDVPEGGDYYIPRNDKVLVASGEQSFLYLMIKGQLISGFYQGITPCFRFESIDTIHRKVFMKNELIYVSYDKNEKLDGKLNKLINDAKSFFETILNKEVDTIEVEQENSIINYDLIYNGQELGSYGIRSHKNMFWVYGTGCAEPRLSLIKKSIL